MAWPWDDLQTAEIEFINDSYVFLLPGKRLKVPGFFVGDPVLVMDLQRAAEVVRRRLPAELEKRRRARMATLMGEAVG